MTAFAPRTRSVPVAELLRAAGVELSASLPLVMSATGIADDSRAVRRGDLYLALRGERQDGRDFVAQAIERGAVAVFAEADDAVAVDSVVNTVPVIAVRGLRARAGVIAARFFGEPSAAMKVVAVTGTNGKTTTSWLIAGALEALGRRAAVIGTLGVGPLAAREPLRNTTPGAVELQTLFAGLRDGGMGAVSMEASSIGVEQHRLAGTQLRVAVFTNLTRDHLDYHGTMDAYAEAKAVLFSWPGLDGAVLNGDDAVALRWLAEGRVRATRVLTYGSAGRGHDIELRDLQATPDGTRLLLSVEGRDLAFTSRLIGAFNASNLMAVFGTLLLLGHAPGEIATALAGLTAPAGRMESFGGQGQPLCVVDYAHTPDALEKALATLRAYTGSRLWCVFGCGGNRDRGKRPEMGAVAARLADRVVVTSDNPREESPAAIIDDVLAGIDDRAGVRVETDRAAAIALAVRAAAVNDVVLVAGKGHEDYQDVGAQRQPFSDQAEVRRALAARAGGAAC